MFKTYSLLTSNNCVTQLHSPHLDHDMFDISTQCPSKLSLVAKMWLLYSKWLTHHWSVNHTLTFVKLIRGWIWWVGQNANYQPNFEGKWLISYIPQPTVDLSIEKKETTKWNCFCLKVMTEKLHSVQHTLKTKHYKTKNKNTKINI